MKKVLIASLLILVTVASYAKKVKFSVDMTGQTINTTGIHVAGDFQTIAGFAGGDWNSASTTLTQEVADTNIYSIIVDIPAFTKYEYKYVNGDQFYEAEFVPQESRVGYNFNDNRWLYVDSLADDTTDIGAIMFAMNAPAGKILVRYLVDMQFQSSVNGSGIHLAGDFQGWDPSKTILYSFGSNIYEIISYHDAGTVEYKFYNGNTGAASETITGACASGNGNRTLQVSADIVLDAVCYNGCAACITAGLNELNSHAGFSMYPNPAINESSISFEKSSGSKVVSVYDMNGRIVSEVLSGNESKIVLALTSLSQGIYMVTVKFNETNEVQQSKLIIE
jgi:alpha-amylase